MFQENVSQLKLSPDMIYRNNTTPDKFPEMVVHNVDVFRAWAHILGYRELQSSGVVLKSLTGYLQGRRISSEPLFVQLVQKLHKIDYFV